VPIDSLFQGVASKDLVTRAWRKVKVDWDAWCARSLADQDIVRLILDGTVIKTSPQPRPGSAR
jgi:putative transposase